MLWFLQPELKKLLASDDSCPRSLCVVGVALHSVEALNLSFMVRKSFFFFVSRFLSLERLPHTLSKTVCHTLETQARIGKWSARGNGAGAREEEEEARCLVVQPTAMLNIIA